MKSVLVYNDKGVSAESFQETISLFTRLKCHVSVASAAILNTDEWEQNTSLLVIPGGRATPYYEQLCLSGNQKIINFVKTGGAYLGICAGGYYGASHIVFEKGNPDYEIITSRALGLYDGIAEGPAYELGIFRYNSEEGAKLARVTSNELSFPTYFNGGCWFHSHSENNNTRIVARYMDIENNPAAIITCSYGKGTVYLSGVHIEYERNDGYQASREKFVRDLLF